MFKRKDIMISIKVNEEELETIKKKAESKGKKVSTYIRESALKQK